MRWRVILALLLVWWSGAPVAAQALEPSGKWVLEATDAGCLLYRDFGEGADKVTFGVRRLPISEGFRVVMISPPPKVIPFGGEASIRSDAAVWNGRYFSQHLRDGTWVRNMSLPADQYDWLMHAAEIDITGDQAAPARLVHTGLAGTLTTEKICERNVLAGWNIDPADLTRVAIPARPIAPETWITNGDYPWEANRKYVTGSTVLVWKTTVMGRAEDCRIVSSSGSKELDEASCRPIVKRARYNPARDADDNPISSWIVHEIKWQITGN